MTGLSQKKKFGLCIICMSFILFGAVFLFRFKYGIQISAVSGIYDDATEVRITSHKKDSLYYTLNGEEAKVYDGPIVLSAGEHGKWYDLTVYHETEDGTRADVEMRTYFVTRYNEKPATTDYIISITGDEEELFGDEKGLFVRGTQYYEYLEENPDTNILYTIIPANYLSDEEIGVRAVIFNRHGENLVDTNCGLKIYGAVTRAKNQKSFRLISRYMYDDINSFDVPFLSKLTNDAGGEILKYKRLSFHNSGNDNGYGFIRNQLCCELARQDGFTDTLVSQSAAVYINNKYMGVYWMQNAFDEQFFREKYGEYNGQMMVLKGNMRTMVNDDQEEEKEPYIQEYNQFCKWIKDVDIQDDAVWQKVTETIDVKNFLQYVAIEYYVNNKDWPDNNVRVYRYVAEDGNYKEDSVFDGKYRYILYDLDYGMGLKFLGWFGNDVDTDKLESLYYDERSALFGKIVRREEARNLFISYVLNLINGSFALENVRTTLEDFNVSRWSELSYMMNHTDILKDSLWESDDNNTKNVENELDVILKFAEKRPEFVVDEINNRWKTGEAVYIEGCFSHDGVTMQINGIKKQNTDAYMCISNVPVQISMSGNQGLRVLGYDVNGTYIEGEEITILPSEYASNNHIDIIPDLMEVPCESLKIAAFRTSGTEDYVTLENNGNVDVVLSKYYLSDDEENPYKKNLPYYILKPGEQITFYGETDEPNDQKKENYLSFAWKDGEPVVLSHAEKGMIEKGMLGLIDENCIDNSKE